MSDSPSRTIVIGGGVAGLATAALLAHQGHHVTLVEQNKEFGGRAGRFSAHGFTWDTGPSWYLMPEAFEHFFAQLGTSAAAELDLVRLDPAYRVFPENHAPIDIRTGHAAELFESFEPGAGKKLTKYLRNAERTYHTAIEFFLYTTFSSIRPYIRLKLLRHGGTLIRLLTTNLKSWVDKQFSHPILRQILQYPAVFLSSSPANTPAMYHLLSHTDLTEGVFYPRGGFLAFVDTLQRLAERSGAELRTECKVEEIICDPGFATGRRHAVRGVRIRTSHDKAETLYADNVVSCADLHHTENNLLEPGFRSYPQRYWKHRDPGISVVVALLGIKGPLPEFTHHQLLLSQDWETDFRAIFTEGKASQSIYISKTSASDPAMAPEDCENLFILIPVAANPEIGHGSVFQADGLASPQVDNIIDSTLDLISQRAGIPDLHERILSRHSIGPGDYQQQFNAWHGNAIGLAHTLKQSAFLRGSNASRKVSGLYYAGATTVPGVGLPMCLISAENVLKRIRGDTSTGPS
ncbi:phytoene desaturase family protein [Corynebacterium freiburgense]|uniref:phytoene desaturase family protein n=1 Tax=Corynebacterium freiburgense TaxID=556548 RepID=UPI0003FAB854|nr:phytoene desaturase family protein [Corynebacterium freiburgense]WJZ03325.1 Dehydrosqualene desaturase [Corynebacterium freiburgense]